MTTYSISAPDGKTYAIDGPAGASQEQVQNEVIRQNPHLAASTSAEIPGERKSPSTLSVIANAPWEGLAGAADVILNAPQHLANLGRAALIQGKLTAADITGTRPNFESFPQMVPAPNYARRGAEALGLITPTPNMTGGQCILSSAIQGATGAALTPASTGVNMLKNAIVGLASGGAGQATTEATGSPTAGAIVSLVAPAAAPAAEAKLAQMQQARLTKQAEQQTAMEQNVTRDADLRKFQSVGYKVTPGSVTPSVQNVTMERIAGKSRTEQIFQNENQKVHNTLARRDIGAPENAPLNEELTQRIANEEYNKGYVPIKKLGNINTDQTFANELDNIAKTHGNAWESFPKGAKKEILDIADSVKVGSFDADHAVEKIKSLRKDANESFKNGKDAEGLAQRAVAKTLEDQIGRHLENIGTPEATKLLTQFRASRERIAKANTVEDALIKGSNSIDATKLASQYQNGAYLTGDLKTIASFANAYKNVNRTPGTGGTPATAVILSGMPSGLGLVGGGLIAGVPGAMVGAGAPFLARRYLASERGQSRALPNYGNAELPIVPAREPVNNLPAVFNPVNSLANPQPASTAYTPNFTIPQRGPIVAATAPVAGPAQLPPPSGQATMDRVAQQRAYDLARAQHEAALAEQRAAQESAANRMPAGGGRVLEVDPITGRLKSVSEGIKGATPDVMASTGHELASAVNKITAGKLFDLSATEKIAWNKTKVDLATVAPEFNKLSEKDIATRMMDRQWVADTVAKAREKAQGFEEIAKRATQSDKIRAATLERDKILFFANELEQGMLAPRPKARGETKAQGPKTREAKRNALAPDTENQNSLNTYSMKP